jgi:hypothetical protein
MDDYPVKVGNMLFTMVDPHRGHEKAYNRWYERDHFYAGCLQGPWLFAGGRWVATRALKDLRFPGESPFAKPVDAGSYLSIYWRQRGREAEASAWSQPNVRWLYENGRGFDHRTHAHTSNYDFVDVCYRHPDGVPVELALDHGYAGLAAVVVEPVSDVDRAGLARWLGQGPVRTLLAGDDVDLVASFGLSDRPTTPGFEPPMALGTDGGRADRLVQLAFLNIPPPAGWQAFRDYATAVVDGGVGRVTFAAPFLPTDVGTDRYIDELW